MTVLTHKINTWLVENRSSRVSSTARCKLKKFNKTHVIVAAKMSSHRKRDMSPETRTVCCPGCSSEELNLALCGSVTFIKIQLQSHGFGHVSA